MCRRRSGLDDIDLRFDFVGEGYGIPSAAGLDALSTLGRTEGILLDPIYSGKAFAGLLADIRAGRWGHGDTVVFLHTGGLPALFAYAQPVLRRCHREPGLAPCTIQRVMKGNTALNRGELHSRSPAPS